MLALLALLGFVKQMDVADIVDLNLYKVLGLQESASSRDIKRAYKRFVVQKNRNQSPSERTLRTWRQTETSYAILSDPSSKQLYDRFGILFLNRTEFSVFPYKSDLELALLKQMYKKVPEMFEDFGGIVSFPIQFNLADFLTGAEKTVSSLQTVTCVCPRGGVRCAKCRQSPWMTRVVQTKVALPPGANEFHRIFVSGIGDSPQLRGAADAVFVVYAKEDPVFTRNGANLKRHVNLTLAQALAGGDVEIENIDGEVLNVPIGNGVKHGEERKIVGKGLPFFDDPRKRGDVVLQFGIEFPEALTEEQKKIVEEVLPIDISEYA
jgi:DnaJ-class molecular chaperone